MISLSTLLTVVLVLILMVASVFALLMERARGAQGLLLLSTLVSWWLGLGGQDRLTNAGVVVMMLIGAMCMIVALRIPSLASSETEEEEAA